MFDLEFFKTVRRVLDWTEAPPTHFSNKHECMLEKRTKQPFAAGCTTTLLTMSAQAKALHFYVGTTYPPYFGLELRTGASSASCWNHVYASPEK